MALCSSDLIIILLVLKRSAKIDWGLYVVDELPFLGYNFETATVSDTVATCAAIYPTVCGEVMLHLTSREGPWLKVTFYASNESCSLVWKRLNGKIDEEEVLGDYDVPDTDSLEILLQHDAGCTQDTSAVCSGVPSAWGDR